jgi:hypothetical protein
MELVSTRFHRSPVLQIHFSFSQNVKAAGFHGYEARSKLVTTGQLVRFEDAGGRRTIPRRGRESRSLGDRLGKVVDEQDCSFQDRLGDAVPRCQAGRNVQLLQFQRPQRRPLVPVRVIPRQWFRLQRALHQNVPLQGQRQGMPRNPTACSASQREQKVRSRGAISPRQDRRYPVNIHSNLGSERLSKLRASSRIQFSTVPILQKVNPRRSRKNAKKLGKNGCPSLARVRILSMKSQQN